MKKFKFLSLFLIPFLTGCDFLGGITGKNTDTSSEHQNGDDQPEPPIYEKWDNKKVDDLVKEGLGIDTTYSVPAYDKCIAIEYDDSTALLEGYFGIYIQTEFEECEMLYSEILEENHWILKEKMGDFCVAFSPDYSVMVEYVYELENRELVIYITFGALVDWPANLIEEAVSNLIENPTTKIPEFEADFYQVSYYDWVGAVAINGYGPDSTVVNDYKTVLEENSWIVFEKNEDTFGAISPNQEIRIDFYFDADRDEFNVDIFSYIIPVKDWPVDQINEVLTELEATGAILPYQGANSGFEVEYDWEPAIVIVHVSQKETSELANEYNQYLIDNGYEIYGFLYNEPVYYLPGTTLGYRAASLDDYIVTIEFMNINNPYIVKAE